METRKEGGGRGRATVRVRGVPPRAFFATCFGDARGVRAYFERELGGAVTRVGPWEGGRRVVEMAIPVAVPDAIRKVIGTTEIAMRETQRAALGLPGGAVAVHCEPELQVAMGHAFQSPTSFTAVPDGEGGSVVTAEVRCKSTAVWGLNGLIEGLMVDTGLESVQRYLHFCHDACLREARRPAGGADESSGGEKGGEAPFAEAWPPLEPEAGEGPGGWSAAGTESEETISLLSEDLAYQDAYDDRAEELGRVVAAVEDTHAHLLRIEGELRAMRRLVATQTLLSLLGWGAMAGAVGLLAFGKHRPANLGASIGASIGASAG